MADEVAPLDTLYLHLTTHLTAQVQPANVAGVAGLDAPIL